MDRETGPVWDLDLLVAIERRATVRGGAVSIHEQLEQALRQSIRSGRLPAGSRLPSSRRLAATLGVSRGVVSEAYGQLAAEGYLTSSQGAPVRVSSAVRALERPSPARSLMPRFSYDMRPTLPDLASFPRDRWQRSIKAALRQSPLSAIGYPDPRGVPELRAALGDYLARVRGAAADPEHLLVCTGFMQGFSLLCRALAAQGLRSIALEDPGWHTHRLIAELCGLQVQPVSVDDEGIDVEALAATDAAVVVVTPSHQFPTGVTLSARRRAALIEWAESSETLIVEDDYDGELRFDRGAVGALQGLAPERVLYAGSASKRLAPAMRIGWLLTPSWLSWQLAAAKAAEDGGSEAIGQLALADFVAKGELDRHLRRMRSTYERRRRALLDALARRLPQARPAGSPCGLFEPVMLPAAVDEPALIDAAASRGLGLEGISLHRFKADGGSVKADSGSIEAGSGPVEADGGSGPAGGARGEPCLLLGYGGLPEPAIERGVNLLVEAFAHLDDG